MAVQKKSLHKNNVRSRQEGSWGRFHRYPRSKSSYKMTLDMNAQGFDRRLGIRCWDIHRVMLHVCAKRAGVSMSQYLRNLVSEDYMRKFLDEA